MCLFNENFKTGNWGVTVNGVVLSAGIATGASSFFWNKRGRTLPLLKAVTSAILPTVLEDTKGISFPFSNIVALYLSGWLLLRYMALDQATV